MKRVIFVAMVAAAMAVAPRAEAALFISLTSGANAAVGCDNSTAAGVLACTGAGFTTSLDSGNIGFAGLSYAGYTFGGSSGVSGAGTAPIGFVSDSKLSMTRSAASTAALVVTFGGYNFTLPAGPLSLSASHTANWTFTGGSTSDFQAWGRADNVPAIGGVTAISPICTTGAGITLSCAQSSPNVPFPHIGNDPYALIGRETINMTVGDISSFQATVAVTAVPEPASLLLFGTGLVGLAAVARRRMRKA